MKDIVIRKANIEDLKNIQKLNNKLFDLEINNFDDTLKLDWALGNEGKEYFENMIQNEIVFVAEYNSKIIGYLAGSFGEEVSYIIESFAELDNMYIEEEYRRFGIGTLLINTFKDYCRANKIQNVKVTASARNYKAIQFYLKNEFEDYNVTFKCKL